MTEKEKPAENRAQEIDFAERESALAKREAATEMREKALADEAEKASQKLSAEFAEKLVSAGRILPRDQEAIAQLLHVLPDPASVNFTEGDASQAGDCPSGHKYPSGHKGTAADFMRDFLNRLPVQVDYAERSAGNIAAAGTTAQVAVPREFTVDGSKQAQHQTILNYAEKHNVTYIEAISALNHTGATA